MSSVIGFTQAWQVSGWLGTFDMQACSAWYNYEETIFLNISRRNSWTLSSHIHTNVSHGCCRLLYYTKELEWSNSLIILGIIWCFWGSLHYYNYIYNLSCSNICTQPIQILKRVFHYNIHIKAYWLYSSVVLIPKSRIDPDSGTRRVV